MPPCWRRRRFEDRPHRGALMLFLLLKIQVQHKRWRPLLPRLSTPRGEQSSRGLKSHPSPQPKCLRGPIQPRARSLAAPLVAQGEIATWEPTAQGPSPEGKWRDVYKG